MYESILYPVYMKQNYLVRDLEDVQVYTAHSLFNITNIPYLYLA